MAKIPTLAPRLQQVGSKLKATASTSERRMTGSRLQKRRYRLWLASPQCAECGVMVAYPGGFELDHKVPLFQGGEDTEENCQILCCGPEAATTARRGPMGVQHESDVPLTYAPNWCEKLPQRGGVGQTLKSHRTGNRAPSHSRIFPPFEVFVNGVNRQTAAVC
ncbi:HNH endonuclease [Pseudomonas aeruginosa]|uniref:HNH endonuclease n=1 Tax=Pseudomonas aeruginosa TaxID=287 RepID=UPI001C62662E|nr:HNH endonuclease signature motif containing protein [Pseudomonas aeruginosa]